ncbi:histidine kinase HHK3 [Penicillium macrosclerotiorum]|uniref:histidine kinase HHK3 n=1 Tax=Penicillium macrosclerotiorum TaxID=303699 RepID=UPI00254947CF|nr:histidine kinase HHK3 [Penicillium macrosclerotiorum]KAJ5674150.1 histidine kinase HHK3 [Penicillium macrosclerotiorum]
MARSGRQALFFPKVDEAILTSKHPPPLSRPQTIAPIFDRKNFDRPIRSWSSNIAKTFYPESEAYGPSLAPEKPLSFTDRYLRAFLADNERLRLSVLWYYTRDVLKEAEFLSGLQEKAYLAQESLGWEFAVIGILDLDVYIRLATVGLELGILPRGETICAHTVTQPPGNVFLLPDLMEDWRFQECPYLESGGLKAYAGVPLRIQTESGESVSLGSLCVASSKSEQPISKTQHQTLVQLGDWVISDLVQCTRARRQRERRRMSELITVVQKTANDTGSAEPVLDILRTVYPDAIICLQQSSTTHVELNGSYSVLVADLQDSIWEDVEYIDEFIANSNHLATPSDRPVRILSAECESISGSSLLVLASNDFHLVFDDVDLWFVRTCADVISQVWRQSLLTEALKAKDKFLRAFSHQLRTPVHGILGSVELLGEELKSRILNRNTASTSVVEKNTSTINHSEPFTYLNMIKMAGQDLTSMINNLVSLNKWSDIALAERHYGMHTFNDLEAELESEISKFILCDSRYTTPVFFTHNLSSPCTSFRTDLRLLKDTLLPLLINAIQHTSEGTVSVTTSMDSDYKQVIVDIEDTGCGIHHDYQKRIFEAFEKVDSHSASAGLGLTLALKFASLINGSIDLISSEVGRGSHFRVTFNVLECDCLSTPPQSLPARLSLLPSQFFTMKGDQDNVSLINPFESFLRKNDFIKSDSIEDCLVIFEAASDLEQHRANLSRIPAGQVGICLVADPEQQYDLEQPTSNIIYLNSPFTTSTLLSALESAQNFFITRHSVSPLLQPPSEDTSPTQSIDHQITYTDEKFQSHELNSRPNGSSSNMTVSRTSQPDVSIPVDLKITVRSLSISSRPLTLIVDDNVLNLRVMEKYCKRRGLPYLSATDGSKAVDIFTQHQSRSAAGDESAIELVLMDLQMPVCGGIEAIRQIRPLEQQRKYAKSSIFVMTGQDSVADRNAADEAGADEYFVKPVILTQLDRLIQQYFPAFKSH